MAWLVNFIRESNRIEGILRKPTKAEIEAHHDFLLSSPVSVDSLAKLVSVVQPDAKLRDSKDVPGVRVGRHVAPPSGPNIRVILEALLEYVNGDGEPFHEHCCYERLHPFTDGNGRSGRALWLWMMLKGSERDQDQAMHLGFLHSFYYQSLEASRA